MPKRRLLVHVGAIGSFSRHGFAERFVKVFWGWKRDGYYEAGYRVGVVVRFQSDHQKTDYGPQVSLEDPSEVNAKLSLRVVKALRINGWDTKLEDFVAALKAQRVEPIQGKFGGYSPTPSPEHPLVQLARQAN